MNEVILSKNQSAFKSIQRITKPCNCCIHRGDIVEQVIGTFPNGKRLVIMKDMYGYHAGVVDVGVDLEDVPAPLVCPEELERMIKEALM